MTFRNRRFRFVMVMVLALGIMRMGMASITRTASPDISFNPLMTKTAGTSAVRARFISYVGFLVESLSIPVSSGTMNSYEKIKLADLNERKEEILTSLGSRSSGSEFYVEKRNLPLLGAIGAMLETAASVRHLWSSNLQWLRFKSNCQSGQALAARLRVMKPSSFYQPAQADTECNTGSDVDKKRG